MSTVTWLSNDDGSDPGESRPAGAESLVISNELRGELTMRLMVAIAAALRPRGLRAERYVADVFAFVDKLVDEGRIVSVVPVDGEIKAHY